MAQVNFEFHVDATGIDHKKLFVDQIKTKAPVYEPNVTDIVANGIEIDEMEFYSYALFEDYNANNPFYNSFRGFSDNAHKRKAELDQIFEVGITIGFKYAGNTKTQIMYAGCGISLSAANKIFNLTNADYIKIPEKPGRPRSGATPGENRTLDFEYRGSDGNRLLQVECKGKEGIGGNLNTKIDHILSKKNAQPAGSRDFCFGVIGSLPVAPDTGIAQCYFVDPDIPDFDDDPINFRLSARLRYYADRLSNLGNSRWVRTIKQLFYDFNAHTYTFRLLNSGTIDTQANLSQFLGIDSYRSLTNGYYFKCTVIDVGGNTIFGRLSEVSKSEFFFYGFIDSLFNTIEFSTIGDFLNYKNKERHIEWSGVMKVWDGYLYKDDVFLKGILTINLTGEVSGVLNRSEEQ